jgi:hypothetical protein
LGLLYASGIGHRGLLPLSQGLSEQGDRHARGDERDLLSASDPLSVALSAAPTFTQAELASMMARTTGG